MRSDQARSVVIRRSLFWLLLLLFVSPVRSELVANLYQADVLVAGRAVAERNAAAREALEHVLVKVSGSREVLSLEGIRRALADAPSLVQKFSYHRAPEDMLVLQFEFAAVVINDLIADSGAVLWTANRPSVLVWLALEDEEGRRFVNPATEPELAAELARYFDRRGVPLQFPLFDLQDAARLGVDQAWRLNAVPILEASRRYGSQEILAGRVAALSTGNWLGDWSYFADARRLDRSVNAAGPTEFLQLGTTLVADDLASRYAVAPRQTVGAGVEMVVSGVETYADYANIVAWLEGLELVEHANVEQVYGDRLWLRLQARADPARLAALIELNEHLRPEQPGPGLVYRWQH